MQNKRALVFLVLMLFGVPASILAAGVFSWTDKDGTVHYGDQVPPDRAQEGHRMISGQGQVLRQVGPRKSEAQLEAERIEAERRAEQDKIRRDQQIRDTTLLATFSSVQEMDRIRDQRLQTLDSLISLGRDKVASWNEKLRQAESQKVQIQSRGEAVSAQLEENIQVIRKQMRHSETKIAEYHQKREETIERFSRDRERFVELNRDKR